MNKALKHTAYITLALAFLLVGTLIFWGVYPYKGVVLKTTPLPLVSDSVKAGDEVYMLVDYCNYSSSPRRTIVRLIGDGKEVVLSNTMKDSNSTGCGSATIPIRIPKGTEAGLYTVEFSNTYYFNPIRTVGPEQVQSLPFSVVE